MGKFVYKIQPSDYWRIGEREQWFEEMAAKGLYLKKLWGAFATFEKGEPHPMKYRIDFLIDKKISEDQLEMYAESGWTYVTSDRIFSVFSSPLELNAPELHTDYAEQSFTIEKLDGKLRSSAIYGTVGLLLMIAFWSAIWFLDGTPAYVLIEGTAIQQTIIVALFGYMVYNSLQAYFSIRTLRRDLLEGKPIHRETTGRKRNHLHTGMMIFFTIAILISTLIPILQLVKETTETLPEEHVDLPIVRLKDIEQNPNLTRPKAQYASDGIDWDNRYSINWGPFAPVQYKTDEGGIVAGKYWRDGSGQYSPSVHTEVYQLSIAAMANSLMNDLVEHYRFRENIDDYVELKHPHLERVIVYEEAEMKKIFAYKGKAVIYVHYYGDADTTTIMDEIEKKMAIISAD